MKKRTQLSNNLSSHQAKQDSWEEHWIQAFASHAERRFKTRALVKVVIGNDEPILLSYIFTLPGGGLVLVVAEPDVGIHEAGNHDEHHEETASDPVARAEQELWSVLRGTGKREIWISSPDQVIFYVERAEEGILSTGFGRLGLSRTPDLILPRSTVEPEPAHHH